MANQQSSSSPTRLGARKLLGRFLARLLPLFILIVSVCLFVAMHFSFGDERNLVVTRIGNLAARTATVLNQLPQENLQKSADPVLSLLLSDPAVVCAVILKNDQSILASAPKVIGCKGVDVESKVEVSLSNLSDAKLSVKYNLLEIESRSHQFANFALLALLIGMLSTILASWYSFQKIVGTPVEKLLRAITNSRSYAQTVTVPDVPGDEMGDVISAFNQMQKELHAEQQKISHALRRLDNVYNETPALMFSVDSAGFFRTVSGHWLDETGFQREEVVGKHCKQFLSLAPNDEITWRLSDIWLGSTEIEQMPLQLACKNGEQLHVLLSLARDTSDIEGMRLCVLSDVTSLKLTQLELKQQTLTDYLTALPNRKGLAEHLSERTRSQNEKLDRSALLFIDLDHFKAVNDSLGHEAGDQLLKLASKRILNCTSQSDFLARLGGDEFAVVLHGLESEDHALVVAERIVSALLLKFQIAGVMASVGASIGVAIFKNCKNSDEALRFADVAMYQSKSQGRNRVTKFTNDLVKATRDQDAMVRKIEDGLDTGRFGLHIQPIVELETLRPVGFEALLRLNCPDEGLVYPKDVIRTAEQTGLIRQLTEWSINEAFAIVRMLKDRDNCEHAYLSVNLSPKQIHPEFLQNLLVHVRNKPDLAKHMLFELTETAAVKNGEAVAAHLEALREEGARIALDDFGTGYSSLAHILRFPIDVIKLDKSFTDALTMPDSESRRTRSLIKATCTLAQDLGITTIAEGIENLETLGLLKEYGVGFGQGHQFSRPLPVNAGLEWFARHSKPAVVRASALRVVK